MALSIKINITDLRLSSIPINTKVADIVASGGTEPYTYSLASGDELFQINGTTVVTKAVVTLDNIIPFSVTVTDSTSASATSDSYYPSMQAAIQYRFSQANYVYKITKDIDLGHGILTIPAGCTLDFQGGIFSNGTLIGNNTKIDNTLKKIFDITITLDGTWELDGLYPEWFGAIGDRINLDGLYIQKCIDLGIILRIDTILTKRYLIGSSLLFNQPLTNQNWYNIIGINNAELRVNGTFSTFSTSLPYNGVHPCSQYLRLSGIKFTGVVPYTTVLDGNKIMRISIDYCTFNTRLVTAGKYIQTLYITNCKINGYGDNSNNLGWLYVYDGIHDLKISKCQFEYSIGPFLNLHGGPTFGLVGISINQCLFEACRKGAAIQYSKASNMQISGCYFEDNKGGHIVAQDSGNQGVNLIGNQFNEIIDNGELIDNSGGNGTYKVVWWGTGGSSSISNSGMSSENNNKGHFFRTGNNSILISDNNFAFNTIGVGSSESVGNLQQGLFEGKLYYNNSLKRYSTWNGTNWVSPDGSSLSKSGTTAQRPTTNITNGFVYYDTTLNKPIWWNGTKWVDNMGFTAGLTRGTTAQRPTLDSTDYGYIYYDGQLGKYIVWKGTVWANMDGTALA